ncbi:MAG: hypothetical protein COZ06_30500 [Armatimonadetes bacterium CG_4_10_14_3_um_filter_66_18]|nr:MAG: hypothetical protein COZ06_30500 [Armatimonadetes bacterium CG_4_10_14_3_um_filter_66_18]
MDVRSEAKTGIQSFQDMRLRDQNLHVMVKMRSIRLAARLAEHLLVTPTHFLEVVLKDGYIGRNDLNKPMSIHPTSRLHNGLRTGRLDDCPVKIMVLPDFFNGRRNDNHPYVTSIGSRYRPIDILVLKGCR